MTTPDAQSGPPADAFVAVPSPTPIQVPTQGGTVLSAAQVVAVSYSGDPNAANMQAFAQWFVSSGYYTGALGEYGVGAGSYGGAYTLAGSPGASISDAAIQSQLDNAVSTGALPAPTAQTLYVLTLPPGTTVVESSGEASCTSFFGYHNLETSMNLVYAVIPVCSGVLPGYSDQQIQTIAASHEIAEAATDPFLNAYDAAGLPYGGEIGDLCADHLTTANGYSVQRLFSNAAAAMGRDPCVPSTPGAAYFGIGPTNPNAIRVPAGTSATVDTIAFATAPIGSPILISISTVGGISATSPLSAANVGDRVPITVTVPAGTPSGGYYGFDLYGQAYCHTDFSEWPVQVVVP